MKGTPLYRPEVSDEEVAVWNAQHKDDPCEHGSTRSTCAETFCAFRWWGQSQGWPLVLERACCVNACIDRASNNDPPCHGYCDNCGELWMPPEATCPFCTKEPSP